MRKSVKKEKELDRSYDYADAYGFANAAANIGFVKRRARRKLRHDEKKQLLKEEVLQMKFKVIDTRNGKDITKDYFWVITSDGRLGYIDYGDFIGLTYAKAVIIGGTNE